MERAIKIFFFFAIAIIVLNYIGPVTKFLMTEGPRIIKLPLKAALTVW
jgi:hypothetical protein